MRKFLEFFGLVAPKARPKPPQPLKQLRVAVHMRDGRTIVHYCRSRKLHANGEITLFTGENGEGRVVAEYAAGVWESFTRGTRKVSRMEKGERDAP